MASGSRPGPCPPARRHNKGLSPAQALPHNGQAFWQLPAALVRCVDFMLFFRRGRATILCAGAAFFAFTASSARAGAWLQPPGRGEIIAMGRFERSDRMFGRNGRLLPVRGYRKFELKIWMEYGVMDRLSLILAPTASTVRAGAGPGRLHDLQGEVEAGARLGLLRSGSHALSLQVTGLLTNRLSGARIGFARHDVNGADIRLLYGRSFALGSLRAFSEVQAGYRFRAGAGDELRWPRRSCHAAPFAADARLQPVRLAARALCGQAPAQAAIVRRLPAERSLVSAGRGVPDYSRAQCPARKRRDRGCLAPFLNRQNV